MKFKKIAIIGKYPSAEENKDIHNQLIQLITHLSQKNIELVIEEKTQKQIGRNPAENRQESGGNPAGTRPESGRKPAGIRPETGRNPADW